MSNNPGTPRRLRKFDLPDGEVRVALSEGEAEGIRQRLQYVRANGNRQSSVVINGSPEHLQALRRAHEAQDYRRTELKRTYGEAYDEIGRVQAELNALESEMNMIAEHAVPLDFNFSKYGYSAYLRAYDGNPSTAGIRNPSDEQKDWESERKHGRMIKLYKMVCIFGILPVLGEVCRFQYSMKRGLEKGICGRNTKRLRLAYTSTILPRGPCMEVL